MTDNNPTSIQAYQKKWHMNIGVVIFGIIFVYLAVTVLMYLTENHISAYEVREGSILRDNAYTGFILRDEVVVPAEADGYVNYYALGGSKAGAKTKVYTLSNRELEFADTSSEEASKLSAEEQAALLVKIQAFSENFKEGQFQDVYTLKDYVASVMDSRSSQNRQAQLDAMAGQEGSGLQIYSAASDGIIVYSTDGYEDITVDKLTEDVFARNDYTKKELKNNAKVRMGDPVYKLIRDDRWSIVIPLDEDISKEMAELKSVKIRFAKDHETATAGFSIHTSGDMYLGVLTLDSSMIRYAEERYLDLELILEDESGLKIPKSSVTNKKFYIIQEDYLTQGGNTKETGVLVETGEENPEFKKVNVYDRDQDSGMVYLNTDAFDEDTLLVKPDSAETCVLNKTKNIKGVYNINKGYAVFKQVNILCESDDYYIVESGSDYGLSNYDHIALNGENVKENDVVF
ncbi:HlyD family efflux transporter periplasmic adaptor subunit [Sporofaciens sp. JLR.KK001]|uniref:HlyD family efflux transporter periplasmic adaptor subunit n=1 Tax=Sporofaciens sp. JLR.KK001 TaxID=3112621 RepID=UPI002FF1A3A9